MSERMTQTLDTRIDVPPSIEGRVWISRSRIRMHAGKWSGSPARHSIRVGQFPMAGEGTNCNREAREALMSMKRALQVVFTISLIGVAFSGTLTYRELTGNATPMRLMVNTT